MGPHIWSLNAVIHVSVWVHYHQDLCRLPLEITLIHMLRPQSECINKCVDTCPCYEKRLSRNLSRCFTISLFPQMFPGVATCQVSSTMWPKNVGYLLLMIRCLCVLASFQTFLLLILLVQKSLTFFCKTKPQRPQGIFCYSLLTKCPGFTSSC